MKSGRIFKEVYEQVDLMIDRCAGERLFFGPRMQWTYAASSRLPIGQPVWWDPDVSFPAVDQPKYIKSFLGNAERHPDLFENDMTYYSPEFIQAIRDQYSEDQSSSRLMVFHLKG